MRAVRRSVLLVLFFLLLSPALGAYALPATDAGPSITSGPLTAHVRTSPFGIDFTFAGEPVLAGFGGATTGRYSSLSFSRDPVPPWGGQPDQPDSGTWRHSTELLSWRREGGSLHLVVGSDDPSGCALAVRLEPACEGSIRVSAEPSGPGGSADTGATSMAAAFTSAADEHFLGFGERENAVDQAGKTVESWAVEGAFNSPDLPFVPIATPPWAISGREDATYFPMPWSLSSRGYGFLVENTERSVFRLRADREDAWSVAVDAPRIDFAVFAGPAPLDVVRRFSAAYGRQPAPAAPWVFGPWWQPTGPDRATLPARFRDEDVPGSVIQTYTHYLPGGSHQGRREQERALTSGLHDSGYAVTTYFNPMVSVFYSPVFWDAALGDSLLKCVWGIPFVFRYNQFLVAQVDFTGESGRAFFANLLSEAVADGHDGWMEDFGEYTPPLTVASDGTRGRSLHNRYPVDYHRASKLYRSGVEKPLVTFVRSGFTGSAPYSPVVWGGDPTTDWGYDGLAGAARQGLTLGASGVGYSGSDIGGFFSITAPPTTPELLVRWIELGAFSGVMRTQSQGWAMPWWEWLGLKRSQIWDPEVLPAWRRYAKLRTQLYPYIEAASRSYQDRGIPLMADVRLTNPDEAVSWGGPLRYMFGPDILVAPVLEEGRRDASVPLPAGSWRFLWDAVRYEESDGSFHLVSAAPLAGGSTAEVGAPLGEIPAFIRAGALLPLSVPDVDTLAEYGAQPGLVHLGDRAGSLRLLAWPDGSSAADALGVRIRSTLTGAAWRLRIAGRSLASLEVEAGLTACPLELLWNGRPLDPAAWSYADGVLRATLSGRGTLRVNLAVSNRRDAVPRML